MGGSMGGFFAFATALDHHERVSSLILMGIPAGFTSKLPLPVRVILSMPVLPGLFMRRAATIEDQHKQYEQMFKTDPASLPELYFRARVAGVKRPGAQQTWPTQMRLGRCRAWLSEVIRETAADGLHDGVSTTEIAVTLLRHRNQQRRAGETSPRCLA